MPVLLPLPPVLLMLPAYLCYESKNNECCCFAPNTRLGTRTKDGGSSSRRRGHRRNCSSSHSTSSCGRGSGSSRGKGMLGVVRVGEGVMVGIIVGIKVEINVTWW